MRFRFLLPALGVVLALAFLAGLPSLASEKIDADRIAKLVGQLGSGSFSEREEASKALDAIGVPALELLRKAAQDPDAEVQRRAEELVQKISKRAEMEKILAPKRLHLTFKETPVEQAVADFAKKSGYTIILAGDKSKLAGRTITLDTGETTFWQAFDQFCEKANLVENRQFVRVGPAPVPVRPVRPLPIKPVPLNKAAPPPNGVAAPVVAPAAVPPAVAAAPAAAPAPAPGAPAVPPVLAKRPLPILPGMRVPYLGGNNPLVLVDGKPEALPTCYAGAVRIQALPPNTPISGPPKGSDEILFTLEAAAEPRLQWRSVVSVQVDKAVDENKQTLSQAKAEAPAPVGGIGIAAAPAVMIARRMDVGNQRQVPVRLKAGDKPSKVLKELAGHLSAQVQTAPEAVMTVENVLKAANKTVKGAEGGFIKVLEAEKQANGQIKIRVELEAPPNIVPAVGGNNLGGFGMAAPGGAAVTVVVAAAPAPLPAPAPAAAPAPLPPPAPAAPPAAVAKAPIRIIYGGGFMGLSLLDDKDQPFQLVGVNSTATVVGGKVTRESTLTYQPQKGQGEASKLIFSGSRVVTVDVPFALKDVPLP